MISNIGVAEVAGGRGKEALQRRVVTDLGNIPNRYQRVPSGRIFFTDPGYIPSAPLRPAAVSMPQMLTLADLRQTAADAVEADGGTQTALAARLGVTPGAISRALKETGGSRAALQARIVETLTGNRVEELDIRFRLVRAEKAA